MSKRVFHHPPEKPNPSGRKYWRSLGELNDTPEFREWLQREFPAGAAQMEGDGPSRRNFLQLMGASLTLAGFGLSSCRRPEAYLVPFSKSVEWMVPGRAVYYATSMPRRRGAMPLIATTTDGRPIKLEGNPLHPASNGATDTFAQASILDLYDPDRSRQFLDRGQPSDEAAFVAALKSTREQMKAKGGEGSFVVVEEVHSPTRERLLADLAKEFPKLQCVLFDPLRPFNEEESVHAAFGADVRLAPRFDKADVIAALDSDFLHVEEGGLEASRDYSNRRRVSQASDGMNRLYVVENRYTITGSMADHRLRCPAGQVGAFAIALGMKVAAALGHTALTDLLQAVPEPEALAARFATQESWLNALAKDLVAARGRSLVLAGPRQPGLVHLIVQAINGALDNVGTTLVALEAARTPGLPPLISMSRLAELVDAKQVENLFLLGGNPVYSALRNLDWANRQKAVPNVFRVGLYDDETSALSRWHVPAAHYLESWGDARGTDGTYMVVQPMILPLFGGWSELDLLQVLLGREKVDRPNLIRETYQQISQTPHAPDSPEFEEAWNAFLRDGFLPNSAPAERPATYNVGAAKEYLARSARAQLPPPPTAEALELVLVNDYKVDDGRYNNNGWLQEMPDPVTKLTWDNAALVSPATGRRLGLKTSDVVELEANGRKVHATIWLAPGHVDNSVTLALGYGRERTGRVGRGAGVDAYVFRTAEPGALDCTYVVPGARLSPLPGNPTFVLATPQEHQSMEGRNIVRELPLKLYRENAGFDENGRSFVAKIGVDAEMPANVGFYHTAPLSSPLQWGMAIDLNTCTGCNACVVACQGENNVPIVGRDQVRRGRAMHWIRIDRYYSTVDEKDEDPQILTQPMLCQQCENAPCETVCPVNATIHSEEGLNVMAYNRCVGTRYCSNNCPYKVRRFNFFNYNERPIEQIENGPWKGKSKLYYGPFAPKGTPETIKLQKNPNVTVRIRGVMEKCTFCIQRIEEAKIAQLRVARDSDKKIPPTDSFKTACQQVCPTEAITFGNLNDPAAKVNKIKAQDRDYKVLEYLNVRPRVSYQARLRNPNPEVPGADQVGLTLIGHDNDPGMDNGHRTNEAPLPGAGLPGSGPR